MLDINKQEMKYSQSGQKVFIPQTDENGNIVYEGYKDSDGNFVPYLDSEGNKIPKGEEVEGFSEPTTFQANISNKLSEVLVKEFGIDDSTSYCQLVTDKGYLPLKAGDVVWKRSEVGHTGDGLVDSETADYIVKGVADEGLTTDLFLLRKNIK